MGLGGSKRGLVRCHHWRSEQQALRHVRGKGARFKALVDAEMTRRGSRVARRPKHCLGVGGHCHGLMRSDLLLQVVRRLP